MHYPNYRFSFKVGFRWEFNLILTCWLITFKKKSVLLKVKAGKLHFSLWKEMSIFLELLILHTHLARQLLSCGILKTLLFKLYKIDGQLNLKFSVFMEVEALMRTCEMFLKVISCCCQSSADRAHSSKVFVIISDLLCKLFRRCSSHSSNP